MYSRIEYRSFIVDFGIDVNTSSFNKFVEKLGGNPVL